MQQYQANNTLIGILKRLDAFGVSIQIKFNEAAKHKTFFGGFITLLIFGLLASIIFQQIYQIYNKSNPTVLFDQKIVSNPSRFDLKADNFSFVLTILDENLHPLFNEQLYTITASFLYKVPQYDSTTNQINYQFVSKDIPVGKCNNDSFQVKGTQEFFQALDYTKMYCIQSFDDIYLQGQFENNEFSIIEFRVQKCGQNSLSNTSNCLPPDEMDNILSKSILQAYYTNSIVQVNDKENPFKSIGQSYYWEGNINFQQNINLLYANTYVEDDDGLFMQEYNTKKSLILNSERTMLSSKTSQGMYKISLYLEKNKEYHYQRGYLKIQQAISQVGGLYNVLFILGCLIVYPYSQMQLNRQLFNSTFSIQRNKKNKDQNNNQRKTSITHNLSPKKGNFLQPIPEIGQIDMKQLSPQPQSEIKRNSSPVGNKFATIRQKTASLFDVFQTNKQDMNDSIIKEENQQNNNENGFLKRISTSFHKIQVNTFEYFSYYFGCMGLRKNDQFEILKFGMKKISVYTDICFIINKLLEIEKLKHLILNDEQIKLFEFIPKPKIDKSILNQQREYQVIERSILKNPNASDRNITKSLQISQMKKEEENNFSVYRKRETVEQKANQINILSIQNRPLYEKALQAKEAFSNIYKGNQKKSKIDLKLIQMLDQDLIGLLNNEDRQSDHKLQRSINMHQQNYPASSFSSPFALLAVREAQLDKDLDLDLEIDFELKNSNRRDQLAIEKDNPSIPLDYYAKRAYNFMNQVRSRNDDPVELLSPMCGETISMTTENNLKTQEPTRLSYQNQNQ